MEETSLLVDALAGFYVVEVVEEAVVVGELVGVEVEGAANLFEELGAGEIVALVGDAEGGEAEAGGGDGGHAARVEFAGGVVGGGAVEDLAGGGAGLLDEEEAGAAFHVVEEGFVGGGEGVVRVGLGCEGIGGSPCLRIETWGTAVVASAWRGRSAAPARSLRQSRRCMVLFPNEHNGEAVCGYRELEFAVVQAVVLGGGHGAGGAELLDLCGHEIAGRAAHGVEGLEDVAVVGIYAEDFNRCIRGDVLEGEVKVLGGPAGPLGQV